MGLPGELALDGSRSGTAAAVMASTARLEENGESLPTVQPLRSPEYPTDSEVIAAADILTLRSP
jgi:hypothetical protein